MLGFELKPISIRTMIVRSPSCENLIGLFQNLSRQCLVNFINLSSIPPNYGALWTLNIILDANSIKIALYHSTKYNHLDQHGCNLSDIIRPGKPLLELLWIKIRVDMYDIKF